MEKKANCLVITEPEKQNSAEFCWLSFASYIVFGPENASNPEMPKGAG